MSQLPKTIGPYRILDAFGQGGTAVVYRAVDAKGRRVAVKTVPVPQAERLASIRREIRALARLSHPGIVPVLAEGVEQDVPWYAMQLVEGQSLRQFADALQPGWPAESSTRAILTLVRGLCAPLAYLHGEGFVHADLKPDNVLLQEEANERRPVLIDFGIVSRFGGELSREELQAPDRVSGTVAYMAPERCQGQLADARADLYSLGCILYELLTGRPPFVGAVQAQILYQHCHAEPAPPSELRPGVKPELDELVLRLLAKEPRRRPGYAEDVAAALAGLGAGDAAPGGPRGPQPRPYLYRPGFVGRERTVDELLRCLQSASAGHGGLLLVGGESGVGKTRLAMALAQRAHGLGWHVLTGDCQPGVLRSAHADQAAIAVPRLHRELEPLREALRSIGDRCRELGAAETERVLGRRGKVLAQYETSLLRLPGQDAHAEPAPLGADAARLRLYKCLTETLRSVGSDGTHRPTPVLLLLDDLQWADELTLGWLEFLARSLAGGPGAEEARAAPLLVLGLYRTEEVGAHSEALFGRLLEAPRVDRVELERLDGPAVGSMVGEMLAWTSPPESFVRSVSRHSEGNPFFVAETLRAAVAEGLLVRDAAGAWQLAESSGAGLGGSSPGQSWPLPRSVRDLVARRLQGLKPAAHKAAEAAAVLGREMDEALLGDLLKLRKARRLDIVRELIARDVLEDTEGGRLRFTHDKIREVAYAWLSAPKRKKMHRAAAQAMERGGSATQPEAAAALGRHWEQAGRPDRARPYYFQAARAAGSRHAQAEAERLYRAYLALVDSASAQSVQARGELGNHLRIQGRLDEALHQHRLALEEACRLGDRRAEAENLRRLGVDQFELLRSDDACNLYLRARDLARELGDRRLEGQCLNSLAILAKRQGRLDEARELYEQAIVLHRQCGELHDEAITLGNLAVLCADRGEAEMACELYERVLGRARQLGDRDLEGRNLANYGWLELQRGRLQAARARFEQALPILRETGDRRLLGNVLSNYASIPYGSNDLEEAGRLYEQALAIHRETGARQLEGLALENLAQVRCGQGRPEEARALLAEALRLSTETGDRAREGVQLQILATLHRQLGESLTEAAQLLQRALRLLEATGYPLLIASCSCERGHLELALGHPARPWLERAARLVESVQLGPLSEVGKELARLQRAVEAFEDGRLLWRGECVQDLPERLCRWLVEQGRLAALG